MTLTLLSSIRAFVAVDGSRVTGSGISEIFTKNIDARKSTIVVVVVAALKLDRQKTISDKSMKRQKTTLASVVEIRPALSFPVFVRLI